MKKFLRLAAVWAGSIVISLAVVALLPAAANFTGYPDNIRVWDNGSVLRVRSGGELQVAAPFAWGGTSGGSTTALTLTPGGAWTALSAGQIVSFIAHTTTTGATSMAISGLTAKNIYEPSDNSALDSGEIVIGGVYTLIYSGSVFYLMGY